MKIPKNKFIAVCVYFAPYACAVLGIVVYALLVNLFRHVATGGMLIEQSTVEILFTYIPISVSLIIVAITVSKIIRTKWDLSMIGILPPKQSKSRFLPALLAALCAACAVFSINYASSVSYVEKKEVGGSYSYYIVESGFFGCTKSKTVLTPSTTMEFDGAKYTIKLSGGKNYVVRKDSKAGKIVTELFFG